MTIRCSESHITNFEGNLSDVIRLLEIHRQLAGDRQGRRYGLECLNKSSIVLILATWEAFIEDLAQNAFECMLANANDHNLFPRQVQDLVWKELKSSQTTDAMRMIGSGWQAAFINHRQKVLDKHIVRSSFNTPSGEKIDILLAELIGLNSMTSHWKWRGMRSTTAVNKVIALIDLRGAIAHRAAADDAVVKQRVLEYSKLIVRLAWRTHNAVRSYLAEKLNFAPSDEFTEEKVQLLIRQLELVAEEDAAPPAQVPAPAQVAVQPEEALQA